MDIDNIIKETVEENLKQIGAVNQDDAVTASMDDDFQTLQAEVVEEVPVVTRSPIPETPVEITELRGLAINIILVQTPEDSEPEFEGSVYLNNPFTRYKAEASTDYGQAVASAYGYFQSYIKPAVTNLEKLFDRIGELTVLGTKTETAEKFQSIASAVVTNISKFFPEVDRISFDPTIDTSTTSVVNETTFNLAVIYKADSETFKDIKFTEKLSKLLEKSKVKVRITFAVPLDKVTPTNIQQFEGYETSYYLSSPYLPALKKQRLSILGELNKGEVKPHLVFSKIL